MSLDEQEIPLREYDPLEPSDDGDPKTDGPQGAPWVTGVWERFPWQPFLNAIVTILCAIASIVFLKLSDGANTEDWSVAPSVLVSILTAVGNASLRYAVGEGFQMAWWSKATERPRTVGRLHEYYSRNQRPRRRPVAEETQLHRTGDLARLHPGHRRPPFVACLVHPSRRA